MGEEFFIFKKIGSKGRALKVTNTKGQLGHLERITETSPGNNRRIVFLFFSAKLLEGLSTIQKEDGEGRLLG